MERQPSFEADRRRCSTTAPRVRESSHETTACPLQAVGDDGEMFCGLLSRTRSCPGMAGCATRFIDAFRETQGSASGPLDVLNTLVEVVGR